MTDAPAFVHRPATLYDLPELEALLARSIRALIGANLDEARVEASFEIMGVDAQLIQDGTYVAVECGGRLDGCGAAGTGAPRCSAAAKGGTATPACSIRRQRPPVYARCPLTRISPGAGSGALSSR
ncbi:MAG: hypothetical protein AABY89_01485 [Acidobacteriota bacterium]